MRMRFFTCAFMDIKYVDSENAGSEDAEGNLDIIPCGNFEVLVSQDSGKFDDAEKALFELVKTKGFGLARKRKSYQHSKTKEYHRYEYECCQGEAKARRDHGKKQMRTFRSNCGYRHSMRFSRMSRT